MTKAQRVEHECEIVAERQMDQLDAMFLSGVISAAAYEAETKQIDRWVSHQVARAR